MITFVYPISINSHLKKGLFKNYMFFGPMGRVYLCSNNPQLIDHKKKKSGMRMIQTEHPKLRAGFQYKVTDALATFSPNLLKSPTLRVFAVVVIL